MYELNIPSSEVERYFKFNMNFGRWNDQIINIDKLVTAKMRGKASIKSDYKYLCI